MVLYIDLCTSIVTFINAKKRDGFDPLISPAALEPLNVR